MNLANSALCTTAALCLPLFLVVGCEAPGDFPSTVSGYAVASGRLASVSILGNGTHALSSVDLTIVADATDGLNEPRDLAFNPEFPDDLWVANKGDNSVSVIFDAGARTQASEHYRGSNSRHFNARPSGIAFGIPGTVATIHDTARRTQLLTPKDFMGPTTFNSTIGVFDAGHASHLDMLHNSPSGVGIAWEAENIYWVFDGYHSSLTRYDFREDHGEGGSDHTDGVIHRYAEGQVRRVPGVASHLVYDQETDLLYVADSGNGRILLLDTTTGTLGSPISPNYDGCTQRYMNNADTYTLVDGSGLQVEMTQPSGLALRDGTLFVSDSANATLYAFDLDGNLLDWLPLERSPDAVMGLEFDAEGQLYFTDASANEVVRISL